MNAGKKINSKIYINNQKNREKTEAVNDVILEQKRNKQAKTIKSKAGVNKTKEEVG